MNLFQITVTSVGGMLIPVLFFLPSLAVSQILKSDFLDSNELKMHFMQISKLYFNGGITLIIFNKNGVTDFPDVVVKVVSETRPTQVSNIYYEKPEWFYLMFLMDSDRAKNIVVILEGLDIEKALRLHREQALWNSQARIIFVMDCENDCEKVAGIALKTVWASTKSLNAVIMTVGKSIQFFSCLLYTECDSKFHELLTNQNLFPSKIPETFDGSVFTVATTVKEPYVLEPKIPLQYSDVSSVY